ncbi:MAG: mobile mystery protein A [Verrucomicrobiota bacterium]
MPSSAQSRTARQRTRQLDEVIATSNVPHKPRNGWLTAIREALGMNKTQAAKRVGITRQSLAELESNELRGAITLATLQNTADALGCELAYMLVPKKPIAKMVSEQSLCRAKQKLKRVNQSQALEASAVNDITLSEAILDLAREFEVERPTDLWND